MGEILNGISQEELLNKIEYHSTKAVDVAGDFSRPLRSAYAHCGWAARLNRLHWERFGTSAIDLIVDKHIQEKGVN